MSEMKVKHIAHLGSKILPTANNQSADIMLVSIASIAMTEKLKKKRGEGKRDWHTSPLINDDLLSELRKHVDKGDMVDVMNFAAMIYARQATGIESPK